MNHDHTDDPCDCSLRDEATGFFKTHAIGAPGCECNPDGSLRGFTVEMGVHGSMRITEREYDSLDEAKAKALRWSQSNSIGSYWAVVKNGDGDPVAQYAL